MIELEGGAGNRILTPGSRAVSSRPRLASSCTPVSSKYLAKESWKIMMGSVKYFQYFTPISAPPHGSKQNFNNISRTKLVEHTSQWRGTKPQLFFRISRYKYCDTHLECFTMKRCYQWMLWLCVTESVTQV